MLTTNDRHRVFSGKHVVALGCFDGVHKGHEKVISTAVRIARSLSISSAVWAFDEPPKNYFLTNKIPLITKGEEKSALIESLGVDVFVSVTFDEAIKDTPPEEFLDVYLKKNLSADHIVCGFNFTFGKNGLGNTELLAEYCKKNHIGLTVIPADLIDGITVSSSHIRSLVEEGNTEEAARFLGRYYSITAPVVNGKKLARVLGFPTLNQLPSAKYLIPRNGVYVTRVSFDSRVGYGITNIGIRPTVNEKVLSAETHIFDLDQDLYGKDVTVEFIKFIRPEQKFPSVEEMAKQINSDIQTAKDILLNGGYNI